MVSLSAYFRNRLSSSALFSSICAKDVRFFRTPFSFDQKKNTIFPLHCINISAFSS
ncbi:hypothetical protein CTRC69_04650 [Chlamydia trachomatis RC-F/69]|nr:hypothetical protein CTL2C_950 [Chlamydia trachomatis L2c]AGJ64336.1 hypothetical protein CTLINITIAL_01275 [Chlamydia trachomatis L2/434/Bu(i)]AGJ65276.1 hypothetical protein CTLFINAL_01275 [Chlamydia trachomatis L2/434/Bu(f)]AGR94322.1 hypothetical protein CTRC69_04650 [Chlamydia trachomatis RC-F/69]AGR95247.1 hypothetical protein CTRC46_04630 [Chlamydia trachomatis RC-L2(s)/46]AGR97127.1 hypothetical protein CTRC943_04620 [Chlamydia trachomatis RC-J/943]AGR98047.1 hypothetical protein CT